MTNRFNRRTRREQRRRLQWVSGTCVSAIAVVLVLASCGTGSTADRASTAPAAPPLAVRRTAFRTVIRPAQPVITTTTTTRPAVNPDTGPPPPNTGLGRRVIYCNSCQTVWLVEADDYVTASYRVSGRRGTPRPGEYHVFRKLEMGHSKAHPDLRLPWFVGFTWGATTDIGFHGIPLEPDDEPIQSDDRLGTPLSSGCVRESQFMAKVLFDWTPVDTLVVVTA
ncbi:MAG: L,D-transpeptidase [Acidimicrobiia bacterium]